MRDGPLRLTFYVLRKRGSEMTTSAGRTGQLRSVAILLLCGAAMATLLIAEYDTQSAESASLRSDIQHSAFSIQHSPTGASAAIGKWMVVPTVTSNNLRDVHMVSANLGWAVGENGTVLRYNGTIWEQVDISTTD